VSAAREVHRPVDEAAMVALGESLAARLSAGDRVDLNGDLGAGKTTLVRGMLRGLGHAGRVKSPTYGLVESYLLNPLRVHHLDLYRLADPEELEFLGLDDLLTADSVLLVEWPERGAGVLPPANVRVSIDALDPDDLAAGRTVVVEGLPRSDEGRGTRGE
jgi:tRNA threonylcarbamoyladenosine biosynthesis protein TsaE